MMNEPFLIRESEEGVVPQSLSITYSRAGATSEHEALFVAMHILMSETGFRSANNVNRIVVFGSISEDMFLDITCNLGVRTLSINVISLCVALYNAGLVAETRWCNEGAIHGKHCC